MYTLTVVLGMLTLGLLLFTLAPHSDGQPGASTDYTLDVKVQKKNQISNGNITSQIFSAGSINTNVGDLVGAKIPKSSSYISVSDDQVFITFNLKLPLTIGSNKSVGEKVVIILKVDAIKDRGNLSKTYVLEPAQNSSPKIANHNVLGGSLDIHDSKGVLHLYLQYVNV